jgi:hypothetical protein
MTPSPALLDWLKLLQRNASILAGIGGVICLLGWIFLPDQFYSAWLTAYFYWLGMALGCLVLAMLHGMTGGGWGLAIRRVLEASYQTLPVLALLFLPIGLGVGRIYEWADPEAVRHSELLMRKAGYLNVTGFQIRAIIYFVVWIGITWILNRSSPNEDPAIESPRTERLQRHSGLSFIAYGFTMTLAAVDWAMSLEPEWYSTMYGLIHIVGQGVTGLAFSVLVVVTLREFEPWSKIVTPVRLNDLGNLMLASVMFWAYCSFFQYLVIWSGNLPEENFWYVHRARGGWQYVAYALAALHFALPFLLLLSRQLKRQAVDIGRIAILLLCMRYIDLYWLIVPSFEHGKSGPQGFSIHWLDLAAMSAIGGAWLWVFAWSLSVRIRLPLYDPKLQDPKLDAPKQTPRSETQGGAR